MNPTRQNLRVKQNAIGRLVIRIKETQQHRKHSLLQVAVSTISLITIYFYSYDLMIRATGRYFCDFLQNVDNIHLQMRFTFPKMKSPSMNITHVDPQGAVLVYRSNRQGFTQYLMGKYRLPLLSWCVCVGLRACH